MISDYFSDRLVTVENKEIRLTRGVQQGSVLGPTLWNVQYNGILELPLPECYDTVAFADDLGLLVMEDDEEAVIAAANSALEIINKWMHTNKLELAPHKTEVVVLKGPRKRDNINIKIADVVIRPTKCIKYLGIHFDSQMNFGTHVKATAAKADRATAKISRIMPNIGGPSTSKRKVLSGVTHSILL